MLVRLLALCAIAVPCLSGCAIPKRDPGKYEIDTSDIGPKPDLDVCRLAAQAYTLPGLKDPASARFTFGGLVERLPLKTGHLKGKVAWRFGFTVTARDESGLYGPFLKRAIWFANDKAIAMSQGEPGEEVAHVFAEPVTSAGIREGAPIVFAKYNYYPAAR